MIKFAQQQSVNNLHIPFAGFDLVSHFTKGRLPGIARENRPVHGHGATWHGEERKSLMWDSS